MRWPRHIFQLCPYVSLLWIGIFLAQLALRDKAFPIYDLGRIAYLLECKGIDGKEIPRIDVQFYRTGVGRLSAFYVEDSGKTLSEVGGLDRTAPVPGMRFVGFACDPIDPCDDSAAVTRKREEWSVCAEEGKDRGEVQNMKEEKCD